MAGFLHLYLRFCEGVFQPTDNLSQGEIFNSKSSGPAARKITITVRPTKTAISSVKSSSAGKMTVKWKKNAVGSGYQIQYSVSAGFKGAKSITVNKNTAASKTIPNLKKGKKYYVRIRTFKKVGKVKYYSAWSAKKAVKIKK